MTSRNGMRLAPLAGIVFAVLVLVGNLMQGEVPGGHAAGGGIARFYEDKATLISVAMMISLISLFFLAILLVSMRQALLTAERDDGRLSAMFSGGGFAALALLAAGFSINSAGALRARARGGISAETAAVFFDIATFLSGLAATLSMAIMLAPVAVAALRFGSFPKWFGWLSAGLAVLGLITPLSFILFLLFPLWAIAASILLYRGDAAAPVGSRGAAPIA